jgi:hypothetical protein
MLVLQKIEVENVIMSRTIKSQKQIPSQYANRATVCAFKTILESLFSQKQLFDFLSIHDYTYKDESALSRQINKGLTRQEKLSETADLGGRAKKPINLEPSNVASAVDFSSSDAEQRLSHAVEVLKENRQGKTLLDKDEMSLFLDLTLRDFAIKLELDCYLCMFNLYANSEDEETRIRAAAAIIYFVFICYLAGEPLELNLQAFNHWIEVKQEQGDAQDLVNLRKIRFFAQFSDEDLIFPTHDEKDILLPVIESGVCTAHVDVDYDTPRNGGAISSYCGAYIKAPNPVDLTKYRGITLFIRGEGALKTVYLEVKAYDGSPHETFKLRLTSEYERHTILIREFQEEMTRHGAIELTFVIKEASSFDPRADRRKGFFEIKNLSVEKIS